MNRKIRCVRTAQPTPIDGFEDACGDQIVKSGQCAPAIPSRLASGSLICDEETVERVFEKALVSKGN